MPLRMPGSIEILCKGGFQIKPMRAEVSADLPLVFSPSISPTTLNFGATGSSAINPHITKGLFSIRSTPPPRFRWNITGDNSPLIIPTPSNPTFCFSLPVEGKRGPASTAKLTPGFSWRTPSLSTAFSDSAGSSSQLNRVEVLQRQIH